MAHLKNMFAKLQNKVFNLLLGETMTLVRVSM